MSDYKIVDAQLGVPSPVSQVDTSARWPIGWVAQGRDCQSGSGNVGAGEFVYVAGSNASKGAWVVIDNGTAKMAGSASTASVWPLGVACGAHSATSLYGWVQVGGCCDFAKATNASIAGGAPLYLGSAAGRVNSTGSAVGFRILGCHPCGSYTSSQSDSLTVQLYNPMHIGKTANL